MGRDDRFDYVSYSRELEKALGIPPLVRVSGKGPFDLGWSQGPRERPDFWRRKLKDWIGNVGIVTGDPVIGVDVDLYVPGADESWEALRDRGFTSYTVTNLTGGGGRHYLYSVPPGTRILSHALAGYPGIDIKGNAGCIVVPPSIHPDTGVEYEWEHSWGPFDGELVELDLAQIEMLGVGSATDHGLRALDDRDETAVSILVDHFGGHSVRRRPQAIEVCRPGKERGVSAEVGFFGPGVVRVWSSNWDGLTDGVHELWQLRKLAGIPSRQFKIRPAEHDTFIRSADMKTRRQQWLWSDFVPGGQLVLAVGAEKLGKSTAAVWLASRATRGELPGDYLGEPLTVALVSAEDDAERVLKPRAIAADADHDRLLYIDPQGPGFSLEALSEIDAQLLILDPMSVYVVLSSTNEHGEMNIRNALNPFAQLAYERDMTVLGIRHTRKGKAEDNPFDVVLGSRAWSAAARSVLFFTKDAEANEGGGGLLFARGNLAQHPDAHRYRLRSTSVDLDDGDTTEVPLFDLTEGGVGISLEEALGPRRREAPARDEAEEFLLSGVVPGKVDDIKYLADQEGINQHTLERARKKLGFTAQRVGFGEDGAWWWMRPNSKGDHLMS